MHMFFSAFHLLWGSEMVQWLRVQRPRFDSQCLQLLLIRMWCFSSWQSSCEMGLKIPEVQCMSKRLGSRSPGLYCFISLISALDWHVRVQLGQVQSAMKILNPDMAMKIALPCTTYHPLRSTLMSNAENTTIKLWATRNTHYIKHYEKH